MTVDEALAIAQRLEYDLSDYRSSLPSREDEAFLALAAEVRRLRALVEWQPIETAPRDGAWFLALTMSGIRRVDRLTPPPPSMIRSRRGFFNLEWSDDRYTHWRPIGPGPGEAV